MSGTFFRLGVDVFDFVLWDGSLCLNCFWPFLDSWSIFEVTLELSCILMRRSRFHGGWIWALWEKLGAKGIQTIPSKFFCAFWSSGPQNHPKCIWLVGHSNPRCIRSMALFIWQMENEKYEPFVLKWEEIEELQCHGPTIYRSYVFTFLSSVPRSIWTFIA